MKARIAAKIVKRDWNTDKFHEKEWIYLCRVTRRWYLSLARKLTADQFRSITGYQGRTNEHKRDAAMLVFGF